MLGRRALASGLGFPVVTLTWRNFSGRFSGRIMPPGPFGRRCRKCTLVWVGWLDTVDCLRSHGPFRASMPKVTDSSKFGSWAVQAGSWYASYVGSIANGGLVCRSVEGHLIPRRKASSSPYL